MPNSKTFTRAGFQFIVDEYATKQWRTRSVEGQIHSTIGSSRGKRKGNKALCRFTTDNPDQTVLQLGDPKYDLPAGSDGGHLIALDIGGIDHPANVVPMPSYFNRHGLWRDQERMLLDVLGGRIVKLKVGVQYSGSSPMPDKLTVTYSYPCPSEEDPTRRYEDTKELLPEVYGRTAYSIPDDIYDQFKTNVPAYCQEISLQDQHPLPYEFLTWLNTKLNHAIIGLSSIANGNKFTKRQRQYIWSLNCWNTNAGAQQGFLSSDITDGSDTYKDLSTKGCLEYPQVDHIMPSGKGGPNTFENGKLTSSWYNNKKRTAFTWTPVAIETFENRRPNLRPSVKAQRPTRDKLQAFLNENQERREAQAMKARAKPQKPTIVLSGSGS